MDVGIHKVNIFTDIDKAGKIDIEKGLASDAKTMMAFMSYELEAMKEAVAEKLRLPGSVNKV